MTKNTATDALSLVRRDIARVADDAKVTLEFADTVNRYGLVYAIEWAGEPLVQLHTAQLAQSVLRIAEHEDRRADRATFGIAPDDDAFLSVLRTVVDEAKTALLRNQILTHSTGMLQNAVNDRKAEATARFVRTYESALDHLSGE